MNNIRPAEFLLRENNDLASKHWRDWSLSTRAHRRSHRWTTSGAIREPAATTCMNHRKEANTCTKTQISTDPDTITPHDSIFTRFLS